MCEDTQELAHPPDVGEEGGALKQKTGSHIELDRASRGFPAELGNIHQMCLHEKKMVITMVMPLLKAKNL